MRRRFVRAVVAGAVAAAAGCEGTSAPPPPPVTAPYQGPTRDPLAAGEAFPALRCAGWLNGEPRPVAPAGPPVHVIDVWATWCPYCKAFGPSLAKLYEKYHPRGVQFVSVTDLSKDKAEDHGRATGVVWPSGYGLAVDELAALGAFNRMAATIPGYNAAPTIFVVGADGKVVGTDEQGRFHHEDAAVTGKRLEQIIERALAAAGK